MSFNYTAEQITFLREEVQFLAAWDVFPTLVATVLFGLFTALFAACCVFLVSKGLRRSRGLQAMSILITTMYTMSAVSWALDIRVIWLIFDELLSGYLSSSDDAAAVHEAFALHANRLSLAKTGPYIVNWVLADAVVLWRAYVIWERPRWFLILSVLLLVISFVFYLMDAIIFGAMVVQNPPNNILKLLSWGGVSGDLISGTVSMSATALANIIATSMIAYKAWAHWRDVTVLLNRESTSTATVRVLALVVESGFGYSTLWVFYILASNSVFGQTLLNSFPIVMAQISGMYPTLVIVLISWQRSLLEHDFADTGAQASHFTSGNPTYSIRFAHGSDQLDAVSADSGGAVELIHCIASDEAKGGESSM